MKRKLKRLLGVFLAISIVTVYGAAQCSEADKAALEKFDRHWGDVNDRASLEKIYASDFISLGLVGTGNRQQAIDGAVNGAANPDPDAPEVILDNYIIGCTKLTATISHRVKLVFKTDGKESVAYSRALHFAEKRDGRWQVVSSTGHPVVDSGALIYKEIDGYTAFMNGDIDWFKKNLADNYMSVNMSGKSSNKAQSLESMSKDKNKYTSIKLSNVSTRLEGDMGIISGDYDIAGTDAYGKPISMKLRFTRTLAKKDGKWVAIASQATRIESAPPSATAEAIN